MTTTIDGSGSATFATPLPASQGGTGSGVALGTGVPLLSTQMGLAPAIAARAMAFASGTAVGTNAPSMGINVTSITRNSVGNYTVIMSTAMLDANYFVLPQVDDGSWVVRVLQAGKTATQFTILSYNSAGALTDQAALGFAVFR